MNSNKTTNTLETSSPLWLMIQAVFTLEIFFFFCGKTQKDSFGSLRNFQGYSNSKDLAVYTSQKHILDNIFELKMVEVLTF